MRPLSESSNQIFIFKSSIEEWQFEREVVHRNFFPTRTFSPFWLSDTSQRTANTLNTLMVDGRSVFTNTVITLMLVRLLIKLSQTPCGAACARKEEHPMSVRDAMNIPESQRSSRQRGNTLNHSLAWDFEKVETASMCGPGYEGREQVSSLRIVVGLLLLRGTVSKTIMVFKPCSLKNSWILFRDYLEWQSKPTTQSQPTPRQFA